MADRVGVDDREALLLGALAEVDALYRLAAAGVRVPTPYNFHEGVLLMELVTDAHGDAAPRLNDVDFVAADALTHHATLIREVREQRIKEKDSFFFNWSLNVPVDFQKPFEPTHEAMAALKLHRNQPLRWCGSCVLCDHHGRKQVNHCGDRVVALLGVLRGN
jgi:hypothetical protein